MKNSTEQTEISVSKIGKFNSPDDLLAAYNALESEFTKRCQLIKQLQAAEANGAQAEGVSDRTETAKTTADESAQPSEPRSVDEACHAANAHCEIAAACEHETAHRAPDCAAIADAIAAGGARAERGTAFELDVVAEVQARATELAEALCDIPEVFDAAVARYKRKLLGLGGSVVSPQGAAVLTPVKRPKTLSDAKRLADELLAL
ncbi:MAG: hypothetical protein NC184_04275 [Roseburia sp.]|nr:hypothetical protein [Roseburia sp.]